MNLYIYDMIAQTDLSKVWIERSWRSIPPIVREDAGARTDIARWLLALVGDDLKLAINLRVKLQSRVISFPIY